MQASLSVDIRLGIADSSMSVDPLRDRFVVRSLASMGDNSSIVKVANQTAKGLFHAVCTTGSSSFGLLGMTALAVLPLPFYKKDTISAVLTARAECFCFFVSVRFPKRWSVWFMRHSSRRLLRRLSTAQIEREVLREGGKDQCTVS